jgi:hypothetical protein
MVLTGTVVLSRPRGLPVMTISLGAPGATFCAQVFEKVKVARQAYAMPES